LGSLFISVSNLSITIPTWFPDFATPDLGCLIRRKHELEVEPGNVGIHVEFVPSIDFAPQYHQTYFRIKCGDAGFFERCAVYRTNDLTDPLPLQPDFVLGGDKPVYATDWLRYPAFSAQSIYWFFGEYRNPAEQSWRLDSLVAHTYDIYENGTLSTVHYDDTGADNDLNDMILEIAIVGRKQIIFKPAIGQEAATEIFKKQVMPRIQEELARVKEK
jgi:hypothetical protein